MLEGILSTIGYGAIIVALLFTGVDACERKQRMKEGSTHFLNIQVAILLAIAGFSLLIISLWVH